MTEDLKESKTGRRTWPGSPSRKPRGWDFVTPELQASYEELTNAFGEAAYNRAKGQASWGELYGESLRRGRKHITPEQFQQCLSRTRTPRGAAVSCVLRPAHVPATSGQRLVNPFWFDSNGDPYAAANAALEYIQQASTDELAGILNYSVGERGANRRKRSATPQPIVDYLARRGRGGGRGGGAGAGAGAGLGAGLGALTEGQMAQLVAALRAQQEATPGAGSK